MPERKGPANRGSLMELSKPRLAQTPLIAPIDEAEQLIFSRDTEPSSAIRASNSALVAALEDPSVTKDKSYSEDAQTSSSQAPPEPANLEDGSKRPPKTTSDAAEVVAKLRKTRHQIAVVGFKLPATLKEELFIVAQHNGTDMTRIVTEALERFLSKLPHPPGWKK